MPPIPLHTRRIGEIEMLRAIAVLMVMFQHATDNLLFWNTRSAPLFHGMWTGVDLFFVISGFVIARSLLPLLAPLRGMEAFLHAALEFWIRRAWRLLPSAWFWLAAPLCLSLFYNRTHVFGPFAANWEMAVSGLLYLANFREAYVFMNHPPGTAFAQWSLSLEEQFYVLLPFAAFFLRRWLWLPLAYLAAVGFWIPNLVFFNEIRLWPASFGVLLAIWSARPSYAGVAPTGLARSRAGRILALLLPLGCLASLGNPHLLIVVHFYGPIALVSAILVWCASYDAGYLCRPGPLRRLAEAVGARSYSLYLVHIPAFFLVRETWFRLYGGRVPGHSGAAVYVGLGAAAVFALAELNHRLLEMPLRDYGKGVANRFATDRRPAVPASGAVAVPA